MGFTVLVAMENISATPMMLQINFDQNLEIFYFESVDNIRRQRTDDGPCYATYSLYISSHFGSSETKSENDELLKIVQV